MKKLITSLAATGLVAASTLVATAPAQADPVSLDVTAETYSPNQETSAEIEELLKDPQVQEILYAPTTGEYEAIPVHPENNTGEEMIPPRDNNPTSEPQQSEPALATYFGRAKCLTGIERAKFATYSSKYIGKLNMYCGNEKYGYRHISQKHSKQWSAKMGGRGGTWDGYMSFSVDAALNSPLYSRMQNQNTRCYVTPIIVYSKSGQKSTFYPRVAASTSGRGVITAFPTSSKKC